MGLYQNTFPNWRKQYGIQRTVSSPIYIVLEFQNSCAQQQILKLNKRMVCILLYTKETRKRAIGCFADKLVRQAIKLSLCGGNGTSSEQTLFRILGSTMFEDLSMVENEHQGRQSFLSLCFGLFKYPSLTDHDKDFTTHQVTQLTCL